MNWIIFRQRAKHPDSLKSLSKFHGINFKVSIPLPCYHFRMISTNATIESQANTLCKSCGLCCTGHLFIWSKLRSAELDSAEALGLNVFRSVPSQRGFSQPCPLWQGECTVYTSPHYPHFCRTYKCKLLKQVMDETTSLPDALTIVQGAKGLIHEVEVLLPSSQTPNFRERLVAHLETLERAGEYENTDLDFRRKAESLLIFYEKVFGVKDMVEEPDQE